MENHDFVGTTAQEEVFRDLLGDFKQYMNHHEAVPAPMLHSDSFSLPSLNSKFPFRIYRPRPLRDPSRVKPSCFREDPLTICVKESKEWEKEMQKHLKIARKSKIWAGSQKFPLHPGKVSKSKETKPMSVYAPNPYLNVVQHLEKQPIPDFCSDYNWLVSGGSTSYCNIGNKNLVLVPQGECQDKLSFVNLESRRNERHVVESDFPLDLSLCVGERVYETVARSYSDHGSAAVRQLQSCSFVNIVSNDESPLSAQCSLKIQNDKGIFTSVDLCSHQENLICTLNSDHVLKILDLSSNSLISQGHFSSSNDALDKWCVAKFSNNVNEVLICDRSCVLVKDIRVPLKDNILTFPVKNIVNTCDDLTCLSLSSRSQFAYVGTSHFLLNLDLRAGWVQRWTHFLHLPPVYCASQSCLNGSQELVLLSSYISNDCTAFCNTFKEEKPQSLSFPVGLPSVGDCLIWAQSQGECLGPSFMKRVKMCRSGLTLFPCENDKSLTSVTTTSVGDVFSQFFTSAIPEDDCIKPYSSHEQDRLDLDLWRVWEDKHNALQCDIEVPLMLPVMSREKLFKWVVTPEAFSERSRDAIHVKSWKKSFSTKNMVPPKVSQLPSWTETITELKTFKDMMGELLLSPWISQESNPDQSNFKKDGSREDSQAVLHELSARKKRTPSEKDSDDELDSASALEMSFNENVSRLSKSFKKRKTNSQGF